MSVVFFWHLLNDWRSSFYNQKLFLNIEWLHKKSNLCLTFCLIAFCFLFNYFQNFIIQQISSRVNDSLEKNTKLDAQFSYDQLSKNELINNLITKYKSVPIDPTVTSSAKALEALKEDDAAKKRKRGSGKSFNKNISLRSKVSESCDTVLYPNLNPCLTEKLDEILNQGILDSFLPFICQQPSQAKTAASSSQLAIAPQIVPSSSSQVKSKQLIVNQKSSTTSIDKKPISSDHGNGIIFSQKSLRKKSPIVVVEQSRNSEPELTIHVCDEVKYSFLIFKTIELKKKLQIFFLNNPSKND